MPKLKPINWQRLVKTLKYFGFDGPYQAGKYPYMIRGDFCLTIPNPHAKEISVDLLSRILRQAGISRASWLKGLN